MTHNPSKWVGFVQEADTVAQTQTNGEFVFLFAGTFSQLGKDVKLVQVPANRSCAVRNEPKLSDDHDLEEVNP